MLKKCWFLLLIILSFSAYGEDNNSLYQLEKLRYEIEKEQYKGEYVIIGKLNDIIGEGTVNLNPEFFVMNFGLKTEESSVAFGNDKENKIKASEENAKTIKEFKDYLISIGVKPENIATTRYTSNTASKSVVSQSASVNHEIKVKFDISTDVGAVLKKIEPTDIRYIGDIVYGVSEKTKKEAKLKAYEIAMEDAVNQAKILTKTGNSQLGDLRNVYENKGASVNRVENRIANFNMKAKSTESISKSEAPIPISVTQDFKISVTLVCSFDMVKKVK
ncbi:SIMPL domain-containing protein [Fusobacterium ulcerans]|uniref:Protein of uncharacterized function (DUF541) n=2 Tax=Fusobacterium ulcerans TaxID=861 RepID=A0AAX2J8J4_9FUSO|nr:SIMPL domain-containing protein [Fusobacterium ulcerans]AVQ28306.1 SIMPL domain-containing protein [Fusobacterium ulcerans]EFS25774.1 hypothetical protein FUAG_01289 [Fusobacterium ulcerans ATCC 49185]EHO80008.1 hypothetical protein HMPREF0402_02274 [Fusobacterium ulcerans 12-1B]SQJ00104.1 Protein of uncharacterised function (DUF541) [Fusobacterium ulcerans]